METKYYEFAGGVLLKLGIRAAWHSCVCQVANTKVTTQQRHCTGRGPISVVAQSLSRAVTHVPGGAVFLAWVIRVAQGDELATGLDVLGPGSAPVTPHGGMDGAEKRVVVADVELLAVQRTREEVVVLDVHAAALLLRESARVTARLRPFNCG